MIFYVKLTRPQRPVCTLTYTMLPTSNTTGFVNQNKNVLFKKCKGCFVFIEFIRINSSYIVKN